MPDGIDAPLQTAMVTSVGSRPRIAIVLFNLGGPDTLAAVRPFLINLFTDPAILRVPVLIRPLLARLIAWRRIRPATENYRLMGGRSPLRELTERQATALEAALPELQARCFLAMRYWHPFSREAAQAVKDWDPDQVVLVPLYPHFSTTTTGSSLTAWRDAASAVGLAKTTRSLCCYPLDEAFVQSLVETTRQTCETARRSAADAHPGLAHRVLFSAHGLPQIIVDRGDPYRFQIEATAGRVAALLALPDGEWRVCFQSRATPQRWLEPGIERELRQAAADGVGVIVVPIAFVSDHSETLVELDIEYAELAQSLGIRSYARAPAQNSSGTFIMALANLVRSRLEGSIGLCSHAGRRLCPAEHADCPLKHAAEPDDGPQAMEPAVRARLHDFAS